MFDISLAELTLLGICTITVVGRKDLPHAAKTIGYQLGRVVGLVQGTRARADRFATDHQLTKLHGELRTGLRQLDAVKAEMAMLTTQGVMGRGLRMDGGGYGGGGARLSPATAAVASTPLPHAPLIPAAISGGWNRSPSSSTIPSSPPAPPTTTSSPSATAAPPSIPHAPLAPRSHSVAAVAEEEWVNRGIGFKSRGEGGIGGDTAGAGLLADVYQQSLIFDQYQRVVDEQNEALRRKVDDKVEERRRREEGEGRRK